MPDLPPEKRATLSDWLKRFATEFVQTPQGRRHLAQYEKNNAEGVANLADVRRLVGEGRDATGDILRRLFPHSHGFDAALPVWIHVAPTVTGDMRVKYERKGWVKPEEWPAVARLVFEFFDACEREPDRLDEWCARFVASPRHKGIQAAFLSPMLHALHPTRFAIINKKPLTFLRWIHGRAFNAFIRNYPDTNRKIQALAAELAPELTVAVEGALSPGDALDMFCHWLVVTKLLEPASDRQPEDDIDEEELAVAEDLFETTEFERTRFPKKQPRLWLIAAGQKGRMWPLFQEQSCIAVSMSGLHDFGHYATREDITEALRRTLPPDQAEVEPVNDSLACWQFSRDVKPNDLVLAKTGRDKLLGFGVVTGDYSFAPGVEDYPHRLPVRWLKTGAWALPAAILLPTKTLTEVLPGDFRDALEKAVGGFNLPADLASSPAASAASASSPPAPAYTTEDALRDLFMPAEKLETILRQLRRRKNIVLQGPPGVGKTFAAQRIAHCLLGARDKARVQVVQFHPSTSYEDFVLGLRPDADARLVLQAGVFHLFCQRARKDPARPHVFVIDEINRGNLARIFGELMMLLEHDKRGPAHHVSLAYGGPLGEAFHVPENVYLIGTMNTADRSLALVDYALRRRFSFFTLEPDFGERFEQHLLDRRCPAELVARIRRRVADLNAEIRDDTRSLGPGYQIGHSFFCPPPDVAEAADWETWHREVVDFEIRPLLEEYWMDSPERAATAAADLLRP